MAAALAAAIGMAVWAGRLRRQDGEAILDRMGRIVAVDSMELESLSPSREFSLTLTSDAGTRVHLRLRVPRSGPVPRQLVVLIDGQGVGADAVDLLPEDARTVVAALDYPAGFPEAIDLGDAFFRARSLRDAALRVPASVMLAVEHLARRDDVDTTRIAVIGSSLGVPAAIIAAALDPRVDGVALIYGGGDLGRLIAANLSLRPAWLRRLVGAYGAWLLAPLEPTRYAGRLAPRPLVMINGSGDRRIPRSSVEDLYRSARPPKQLLWLDTGHLEPWDRGLIRALVDSAVSRLPMLSRTPE